MMDLATWLEGSALSVWVRESSSVWAYPTILTIHTLGLGVLVGANVVVNFRLLGWAPRLPVLSLTPLYRFMWFGLVLNVPTGLMLYAAVATTKGMRPVFFIKLSLIALALISAARIKTTVFRDPVLIDSGIVPLRGRRLAVLSLVLWAGAITAGRLMAYL